jgi:hypothetical protein
VVSEAKPHISLHLTLATFVNRIIFGIGFEKKNNILPKLNGNRSTMSINYLPVSATGGLCYKDLRA